MRNAPSRSPWGSVQSSKAYGPFWLVSTAGHGGLKVPAALNRKIPEYMRQKDGWYEEDCEVSIVVVVFPEHFPKEWTDMAPSSLANQYPDAYERFYGKVIPPGSSYVKDERAFKIANADKFIVQSAYGDWQPSVPKGMVGCCANRGGNYREGEQAWFLVPEAEYAQRSRYGFVIDEARHQRVEDVRKALA